MSCFHVCHFACCPFPLAPSRVLHQADTPPPTPPSIIDTMNQEIEELRAEKEALKLQLQEAKEAKDRRRLKAEMNTVIDDLERRLPLCVVCATNVPDRIFISCMHVCMCTPF